MSVCAGVCMQGVCAREVSRFVPLHLTSILITPFQQRSSSQTLPQSNGLTWEASLRWRTSRAPLIVLLHTRTHAHTDTHMYACPCTCVFVRSFGNVWLLRP